MITYFVQRLRSVSVDSSLTNIDSTPPTKLSNHNVTVSLTEVNYVILLIP